MPITVNDTEYDSWDDVPPELRQALSRVFGDSNHDGVPDVFENGGRVADSSAISDLARLAQETDPSKPRTAVDPTPDPPEGTGPRISFKTNVSTTTTRIKIGDKTYDNIDELPGAARLMFDLARGKACPPAQDPPSGPADPSTPMPAAPPPVSESQVMLNGERVDVGSVSRPRKRRFFSFRFGKG